MQFISEEVGEFLVVRIHVKSLTAANAKEFTNDIAEHFDEATSLVLDLGEIGMIDSTGLGALISFAKKLHATGCDLKLCGVTKPVRSLFELVRHKAFDIYNDVEEVTGTVRA